MESFKIIYSLFDNNPDCYKVLLRVQVGTIVFLSESSSYWCDWGQSLIFNIIYFLTQIWSRKDLSENNKGFKRKKYPREELQKRDFQHHQHALYKQEDRLFPYLAFSTDAVRTISPKLSVISVVRGRYTNKTIWVRIIYFRQPKYDCVN